MTTNKLTKLMDKYRKNIATYDTSECTEQYECDDEWDNFKYDIKALIKRMRTTKFFCYGLSLTWQRIAGYSAFTTDNPEVLIRKISPDSNFTMRIYTTKDRGIYEVVTHHHDAPTGETMYLMSQTMAKKKQIMETYFS